MTNKCGIQAVPGRSLASMISSALRRDLTEGVFRPGDRLPSESALSREYSVSRTVVREAVAILRADGLVHARKGAGVYALDFPSEQHKPFTDLTAERITSVIEILELRVVVETEAAGLAATRRSAPQIEAIMKAHGEVGDCLDAGRPTPSADINLHLAIADATQNRRFPEFLKLIRNGLIPRDEFQDSAAVYRVKDYNLKLQEEHEEIVNAIIEGDASLAKYRMNMHLRGSLARYKLLLRSMATNTATIS